MSNQLHPVSVEMRDVWSWAIQAVGLYRRKPIMFTALSVGFFYCAHLLAMTGYLTFFVGLVLCQGVLVLNIELGRTVDESKPVSLNRCYVAMQKSIVAMLLLALFYVLMWVIAAQVATMFAMESSLAQSFDVAPISFLQWLYPGTVGLFVVYIGIMVSTMWFLLPVLVFVNLGFTESMRLAKQGERINFLVVVVASYTPFFLFFILFLFSELALVVAIVGLPWFALYLFVSFRHVYMGRKENAPEVVRAVVADTQTT
ncbi:MAG: hypothetical protein AAF404_14630 [Pseudomonadota bacterium]